MKNLKRASEITDDDVAFDAKVMQRMMFQSVNADHMVSSIIAFTMSLLLFFRALTALDRDTLAWDMTSSMSLSSTPSSSTSSSSSSSGMAGWGAAAPLNWKK